MADKAYGVNGRKGVQHIGVKGWENTSVGMAGSVKVRMNGQNGVQSNDPTLTTAREAFHLGRFFIKITRYPPFFSQTAKDYLAYLVEDCAIGFSGIAENSIETFEVTNGTVRAPSRFYGNYKEGGSEVSITIPEYAGSPVRKILDYWLGGISDRKSAVRHLYGRNLRPVMANMTMDILIGVLGPSCHPDDLEFATFFANVGPNAEKLAQYNLTNGEVNGSQNFDIPFAGLPDRGDAVNIFGKRVATALGLYNETAANSRLPAYVYEEYLNKTAEELRSTMGADLATRIGTASEIYTPEVESVHEEQVSSQV